MEQNILCVKDFFVSLNSHPIAGDTVALYQYQPPGLPHALSLERLNIATHLPLVFDWVNLDYAKAFWQMSMPFHQYKTFYQSVINSSVASSIICYYNTEPVAQVDIYNPLEDEISKLHLFNGGEIGMHILMGPVAAPVKNLSMYVIHTCLHFLFKHHFIRCIYGEPDTQNIQGNRLILKAGFSYLKTIVLSYKKANLYCITPELFKTHPLYYAATKK